LWVRDRTDCSVGGVDIPVAWFAGAPSALVLLIAPLLTMVFARLQRVQREPSVFGKIMLGFVVSCLAAVPVWIASVLSAGGQRTSVLWVLLCLAMLATSELLVLALAPSELTRLAPTTRRGRWLSYWFVAQAIGNLLGGWLHF
jgi:POT family proton-dependent oligopeptide transporter